MRPQGAGAIKRSIGEAGEVQFEKGDSVARDFAVLCLEETGATTARSAWNAVGYGYPLLGPDVLLSQPLPGVCCAAIPEPPG